MATQVEGSGGRASVANSQSLSGLPGHHWEEPQTCKGPGLRSLPIAFDRAGWLS
jgi:hypothetical protein